MRGDNFPLAGETCPKHANGKNVRRGSSHQVIFPRRRGASASYFEQLLADKRALIFHLICYSPLAARATFPVTG
jgi:hypothetical protein